MPTPNVDPPPDDRDFRDSETALGGADAVEKTSYGNLHGAEPGRPSTPPGTRKGDGPVHARVSSGGGLGVVGWATALIALAALLIYAFGIFS